MWDQVDTRDRLIITEGEKKTLCGDAHSFPTIGVSGVWNWMEKQERDINGEPIGKRKLIPDLLGISWTGKTVYIAFDSDWRINGLVRHAAQSLGEELAKLGAVVRLVDIPDAANGGKQGLDDFIVANGENGSKAFNALLDAAVEWVPDSLLAAPRSIDDPHRLACEYLNSLRPEDDPHWLRFWKGSFWEYDGTRYRGLTDDDIKARLSRWTRRELDRVLTRVGSGGEEVRPIAVTQKLVGNIQQAAMSECCVPSTTEMPIWIDCAGPCPRNVVPVQNGLLDVVSGELHPHTPAFFSPTVVPYAYDPSAPEPREWLRFLDSVFHDDRESIITLQEWFGYLLTADTSQQKILLMIGPKRSGKGTILRVLTAMVGKGNVVSPSFGSLAWVHGLQEFPGKTIATISDARLDSRKDGSTAVERLLSISGEDTVTVNPKNRALFSARLLTRFVIATNELPRFGDASGALPGRFIILRFLYSYYGREDHGLENRLIAELPGILNWSIVGLRRLRERGRFRQPASSQELMQTLEELASPVGTFIADRGFVHRAATVPINDLYQAYRLWCEDNGHMPGSKQVFGRNLQAVLPQVQIRRIGKASDRHRVYQGIRLRRYDDPETPETDDPGGKPGVFPSHVRDDVRDQIPIADMRNQQTSAGISKDRKMSAMSAMSAIEPENSSTGKEKIKEPPSDPQQATIPGCVDLEAIRSLMH